MDGNGFGLFLHIDGTRYEGRWKKGIFHGFGKLTSKDGRRLEGEWLYETPWNITEYDKNGKINGRFVNGNWIKN